MRTHGVIYKSYLPGEMAGIGGFHSYRERITHKTPTNM